MKLLLTGFLLCAFVLSTYGHDYRDRSHHSHHNVKKAHHHYRQNPTCLCPCACNTTTSESTTASQTTEPPTTPSTEPATTSPVENSTTSSTETSITSSTETSTTSSTETSTSSTSEPSTSSSTETSSQSSSSTSTASPTENSTTTVSVSPEPNNNGLQIYVNASVNVIAVVNVRFNVAFVLDVNNNLAALFNGSSGTVIIINLQTRVGYYISARSSVSWDVSQESFQSFFARLNLAIVLQYAASNGARFALQSPSAEITKQVTVSLQVLGVTDVTLASQGSVALWVQLSVQWSATLQGSLSGFLTLISSGVIRANSLSRIVAVFQGIAVIVGRIQGGVSVLIQKQVRIDLSRVLSVGSSVEVLVYFVTVLRQSNVDVSALSSISVFELLILVSGNSTVGASGVLTVIGQFVALSNKQISFSAFIQLLIRYYRTNRNSSVSIDVVVQYFVSLRASLLAWGWSQAAEQISLLLNKNLVINGVNIYTLIIIILQRNAPLQNIAELLVVIQNVVEIQIAIGELFVVLVEVLLLQNSRVVIGILLGIEVQIASGYRSVLAYILRSISLTSVLRLIALGAQGFYEFLLSLNVFGQIIATVNAGLVARGSVSIQQIFSAAVFRQYAIRILQIFVVNISGGFSISVGKHLNSHNVHHNQVGEKHFHNNLKEHGARHASHHGHDKHGHGQVKHHAHE